MTLFKRARTAAAAAAVGLMLGSGVGASPLVDLPTRAPILTGSAEYFFDPDFGETAGLGLLSLFLSVGGDVAATDGTIEINAVFDPLTPGENAVGDLFVTGVDAFGFDPLAAFLTSVTLLRFEVDTTYLAFLFGGLDGQAAALFGPQALVVLSGLDPEIDIGAFGGGTATVTLSSMVPLPFGGVLLVSGLAGLALLRRRQRAGATLPEAPGEVRL